MDSRLPSHSSSQPPLHPPSYLHCIFWECEVSLLSKSQTRNIARQIPNDKFRINPTNPTESWRREKVKLDRQQHELLKNKEWTMIFFITFSSKLCCNNGIYPSEGRVSLGIILQRIFPVKGFCVLPPDPSDLFGIFRYAPRL